MIGGFTDLAAPTLTFDRLINLDPVSYVAYKALVAADTTFTSTISNFFILWTPTVVPITSTTLKLPVILDLLVVKVWVLPIPTFPVYITRCKSDDIPVLVVTSPTRLLSIIWTNTLSGNGAVNEVFTLFIASVWYVKDVPAPGL